jgi:hypothetical protein
MLPFTNKEHRSLSPQMLKPYTAPKVTILTFEAAEERLLSEVFLGNTAKALLTMRPRLAKEQSE